MSKLRKRRKSSRCGILNNANEDSGLILVSSISFICSLGGGNRCFHVIGSVSEWCTPNDYNMAISRDSPKLMLTDLSST